MLPEYDADGTDQDFPNTFQSVNAATMVTVGDIKRALQPHNVWNFVFSFCQVAMA